MTTSFTMLNYYIDKINIDTNDFLFSQMQTNQINILELTQILKKVVWDYNIKENQLLDIYFDKVKSNSLSSNEIKTKLLNGFSWYKLIDVLGLDEAKKLLQDDIIKGIYPKSYRETIYNASKILNS